MAIDIGVFCAYQLLTDTFSNEPILNSSCRRRSGGRLLLNAHAHDVYGFAWSDMVHGCMVYTERAETAAVLWCGTSHVSAVKYNNSVDIKKRKEKKKRYRKLVIHVESHASAVSLLKSRE